MYVCLIRCVGKLKNYNFSSNNDPNIIGKLSFLTQTLVPEQLLLSSHCDLREKKITKQTKHTLELFCLNSELVFSTLPVTVTIITMICVHT